MLYIMHNSTFHAFLMSLATFDCCYLLTVVAMEALELDKGLLSSPQDPPPLRKAYVYLYPKFLWPLHQIFLTCSIYMTVTISVNRGVSGYLILRNAFYTKS